MDRPPPSKRMLSRFESCPERHGHLARRKSAKFDHELFDDAEAWKASDMEAYRQKTIAQQGTVGSGNHYVDLMRDESCKWTGPYGRAVAKMASGAWQNPRNLKCGCVRSSGSTANEPCRASG